LAIFPFAYDVYVTNKNDVLTHIDAALGAPVPINAHECRQGHALLCDPKEASAAVQKEVSERATTLQESKD
jgi:hypothetical protein